MSVGLNRELKKLTGAYCEEAPENAVYPYKVFSARRVSEVGARQVYVLEVNVWDQDHYYTRAEAMMDGLEKDLHKHSFMAEGFLLRIFKGKRQNIPDPDKTIKRVQEQFEMHVYEREGQS